MDNEADRPGPGEAETPRDDDLSPEVERAMYDRLQRTIRGEAGDFMTWEKFKAEHALSELQNDDT